MFLAYASRRGQAFIDRELYLPEEWAEDKERRERAGVPEEVGMRTKPELAKEMLQRALGGGVKAAWVLADCVYGDSRRLGMFLEEREQPYVLALSGKAYVWAGLRQHRVGDSTRSPRARRRASICGTPEEEGWKRLSAGEGSKGPGSTTGLRLPLNPPHAGRFPEVAGGAPLHRGSRRTQRLYGLLCPGDHARRAGEGSRQPLAGGDRI